MSASDIQVKVRVDATPLLQALRKLLLISYSFWAPWERFFIAEWWALFIKYWWTRALESLPWIFAWVMVGMAGALVYCAVRGLP